MNISLSWLKKYIETNLTPEEIADVLTSIGLEVSSVEELESIPGGLRGCVVGKVVECVEHPNSDHLNITQVDLGDGTPTQIVCGAPNVAKGQTVIVATIGTTLYDGKDSFQIKKSKLRGETSNGMICSEKELQVGTDTSGILVLDDSICAGTPASDVFNIDSDYIVEVDITPNRVDATSHYGVARELYAYLSFHSPEKIISWHPFSVNDLTNDGKSSSFKVKVNKDTKVIRYAGICIDNITVKESPNWLKMALTIIGQKPINNIVDITNYVLHSIGQPLHAFDLKRIHGNEINVRLASPNEKITLLDETEIKLTNSDVVIANANQSMCLAGVMGGLDSGVNYDTKSIFLESATFDPTMVRKTSRRYGLNTDSSFRFERGLDSANVLNGINLALALIKEVCPEAVISSSLFDEKLVDADPVIVNFEMNFFNRLIGKNFKIETASKILESLDFKIEKIEADTLKLIVPKYRIDVTRPVDVAEEILRIYGYNNIPLPKSLHASLSPLTETDKRNRLQVTISEMLTGAGFIEVLNNSLSSEKLFLQTGLGKKEDMVYLLNPLSGDLGVMRPSMIWGGLQNLDFNLKRKSGPISIYEFGTIYHRVDAPEDTTLKGFREDQMLALWTLGGKPNDHWKKQNDGNDLFTLKAHVYNILSRLGIAIYKLHFETTTEDPNYVVCEQISNKEGQILVKWGQVSKSILKIADIESAVFYAEFYWNHLTKISDENRVEMYPISKYPSVRRDFALLINNNVSFAEIERVAYSTERNILKSITLFDVYEDPKHLPPGKKSYAVAFELQNNQKTLSDKAIESTMNRIQKALERELDATLR